MPSRLVQRVHFEDFGGHEFERLVFAYHVRAGWSDLAWYGQTGSDQGRDIIGVEPLIDGIRRTIIQCVNRGNLTQNKAKNDLAAAVSASPEISAFKFVTRGAVPAKRRDAITSAADAAGISHVIVWSGVEFEEHLRLIGEDLLRRFCDGEAFPDNAQALRRFADDYGGLSDRDALEQMAAVFDRPAFHTPFHAESSLPAFQQAIEDTISALNTGIWRNRQGDEIRRIPTVHHLRDPRIKAAVAATVRAVDQLRRTFVSGLRDGSIRPCGCGNPDCPTFMLDWKIAAKLDQLRSNALDVFRTAYPSFAVALD
jgi:hypothetical protein